MSPTTVLPGNVVDENNLSTKAARRTEAGRVNADEAGDAPNATPPEANEDNAPQQNSTAASEHHIKNSDIIETATAAFDGVSKDGSFVNNEEGKCLKESASSGNCGGGRGCPVSNRDSDFDGLLADYVDGPFGEAGGGLLIPLGGLRLLR